MQKEYKEEVLVRYQSLVYWKYRREIESWDWEAAKKEALGWCTFEEEYVIANLLFGTVMNTYPSGKYWVFWACSNVNEVEMIQDTAFGEALRDVADKHGCWIENGEGDLCDLFLKYVVDDENLKDNIVFVSQEFQDEYEEYLKKED